MTIEEVVLETRKSVGDDVANRVQTFGPILNTSLYAPSEPDEDAATSAWDAEASVRALLNENSSVRQRVLVALDPRPLTKSR
jgi:hypothetical protein